MSLRTTLGNLWSMALVSLLGTAGLLALAITLERPLDQALLLGGLAAGILIAGQIVLLISGVEERTLLPLVALLAVIGLVFHYRIQPDLAFLQVRWLAVAMAAGLALAVLVPDYRSLARYKYLLGSLGLIFLLAPIFFGVERGGAKLWLQIGTLSFQPAEVAKILLAIFFAAYLAERAYLLSTPLEGRRFALPPLRHLGPLLLVWALSLLVLVYERDLGSSLLFFSLFLAMLYVATGRPLYPAIGVALFLVGALASYYQFDHVQTRVDIWLDPWSDPADKGYQIVQSLIAIASGGLFGQGLGNGEPGLIPAAETDFILAVIGEELGLAGIGAVILAFILITGRAVQLALDSHDRFGKLLGVGLAVGLGLQAVVIMAGVTKAAPLTGITLPYVSYGGSSLLANFLLLALLLRIGSRAAER